MLAKCDIEMRISAITTCLDAPLRAVCLYMRRYANPRLAQLQAYTQMATLCGDMSTVNCAITYQRNSQPSQPSCYWLNSSLVVLIYHESGKSMRRQ